MYTVKQLSDLAEVSVRTLHYYDEFSLLHPSKIGSNGYRYYDEAALLRLQQILFYREIGLELAQIKDILDQPDFDLTSALTSHRATLAETYKFDPAFRKTFEQFHDDLADYLHPAITSYVDAMEDAELAQMLADDAVNKRRG